MAKRRTTQPPRPPVPSTDDDAGQLGQRLAADRAQQMGADVTDRYAAIGARWLSDPLPTRLDNALIDRLAAQGFRRESLAEVRVHRGSRAQAAADALDARAFAIGDADVFFAPGQYDPTTPEGRAVIAHELAHVAPPNAQQTQSGSMPILNERRRRDDASDGEAAERVAREAEARVFAQESQSSPPELAASPQAPPPATPKPPRQRMDPNVLENKVMAILERMQRTDGERSGRL